MQMPLFHRFDPNLWDGFVTEGKVCNCNSDNSYLSDLELILFLFALHHCHV